MWNFYNSIQRRNKVRKPSILVKILCYYISISSVSSKEVFLCLRFSDNIVILQIILLTQTSHNRYVNTISGKSSLFNQFPKYEVSKLININCITRICVKPLSVNLITWQFIVWMKYCFTPLRNYSFLWKCSNNKYWHNPPILYFRQQVFYWRSKCSVPIPTTL